MKNLNDITLFRYLYNLDNRDLPQSIINWYWDQKILEFAHCQDRVCKDELCSFTIHKDLDETWGLYYYYNKYRFKSINGADIVNEIRNDELHRYKVESVPFFESICSDIETKGWVDIENEYYQLLKKLVVKEQCDYTIKN